MVCITHGETEGRIAEGGMAECSLCARAAMATVVSATYEIVEDGRAIRCTRCGRTSWCRQDVEMLYCGQCGYHPPHRDIANGAPRWPHSCRGCTFLGSFTFDGPLADGSTIRVESDLYACGLARRAVMARVGGPSILCRFGGNPEEYASFDEDSVRQVAERIRAGRHGMSTHMPGLLEALRRLDSMYGDPT